MSDGRKRALILFAHGSRDPKWAEPFQAVRQRVLASRPSVMVELAFLEIMPPSLAELIDRLAGSGCMRFTIAPLFMAPGAHLKRDLAQIVDDVKQRYPDIQLSLLPAVGEVEDVLDAISVWLVKQI